MNRLILTTFCTLIFTITGFTQFQFGPLVGANLSSLNIPDEEFININDRDSRVVNTKTGLVAGAIIIYNFSPMIGVQLEYTYTQGGAYIYSAQTAEGLILEIDQTIEMSYITVPILFKVSFPGDFITPYLLAGGNIGFPLDDTKLTINNVTVNGEDLTNLIPDELINQDLKNESIDFGINFGAGISLPLGLIDFYFQAQYNLGLTDLNDEEPQEGIQKDVIKNRGFEVTGGVLFTL